MSRIYVCISSVVCLSVCLYVFVYADVTDMQARYPLVGFTGLDLGWVEGTVLSVLRVMSYRASYPHSCEQQREKSRLLLRIPW